MKGKVAIVGGAGRVGSCSAYALQLGRTCEEIILVDAAAEAARGEALDLAHGRQSAIRGYGQADTKRWRGPTSWL